MNYETPPDQFLLVLPCRYSPKIYSRLNITEDRAEEECDRLYVDVMLEPGEGLVWEIEPTPDEYLQEILYF